MFVKKFNAFKFFGLFLLIQISFVSQAQVLFPDTTFGTKGIYYSDRNTFLTPLPLSNGKIFMAGLVQVSSTVNYIQLSRLNSDGTLDISFNPGGNGYRVLNVTEFNHLWPLLTRLPDGNILISVNVHHSINQSLDDRSSALLIVNENGELQKSFSGNGIIDFKINARQTRPIEGVVTPDNKILSGGIFKYNGSNFQVYVRKYNLDGTPDNSFGNGGQVLVENFEVEDVVSKILFQEDGKILLLGTAHVTDLKDPDNSKRHIQVTRLNSNGTVDFTFGQNGKERSDLGDKYDGMIFIETARFLQDKILLAGRINNNPLRLDDKDDEMFCIKLSSDGKFDNFFQLNNKPIFSFSAHPNSIRKILILEDEESFYLAGNIAYSAGISTPVLLKYKSNGEMDSEFAESGMYKFSEAQSGATIFSVFETGSGGFVALTSDGGNTGNFKNQVYKFLRPVKKKQKQLISFTWPLELPCIVKKYPLKGISTSGLPVQIKILSGPGRHTNDTLIITGIGDIILAAFQPGNDDYDSTYKQHVIKIYQDTEMVCDYTISQDVVTEMPDELSCLVKKFPIKVTASSGLPVKAEILSGSAYVKNDTLFITGKGEINLQFIQQGNQQYKPETRQEIIKIKPDVACEILVYDFVSPNNDGKNDYLEIANIKDYPENSLYVYDRWGTLLYKTSDYRNDWNGRDLPAGSYYYHFRINGETVKDIRGTVVLSK